MTTSSRPPLWEVLRHAYDTSPPAPPWPVDDDWTDRYGYAAEIRALLTTEADRAERGEAEE